MALCILLSTASIANAQRFETQDDSKMLPPVVVQGAPKAQPATLQPFDSLPGATDVIFLDFDGYTAAGTPWNERTRRPSIVSPPAMLDAQQISEVCSRVAEIFRPFKVNVTNRQAVYDVAPSAARQRVVFTNDSSWAPQDTAGLSLTGAYGYGVETPAYVFTNKTGYNSKYSADAAAHELGHAFGLSHDGQGATSYYGGAGGWGPIMGAPYLQTISQFSRGDYQGATNSENDFAIIQRSVPPRDDSVGNSPASATPLTVAAPQTTVRGVIETAADKDVYRFVAASSRVMITAKPNVSAGATSLTVSLQLLDTGGNVLATTDSTASQAAQIDSARLLSSQQTYYVAISGIGKNGVYSDYGSVGEFTLTLQPLADLPPTVTPTSTPSSAPTVTPRATMTAVATPTIFKGSTPIPIPTLGATRIATALPNGHSPTTAPTSSPVMTATVKPTLTPTVTPTVTVRATATATAKTTPVITPSAAPTIRVTPHQSTTTPRPLPTIGATPTNTGAAPVASDSTVRVTDGGPITITLNAVDPNGLPLEYRITSRPRFGVFRREFIESAEALSPSAKLTSGQSWWFFTTANGQRAALTISKDTTRALTLANSANVTVPRVTDSRVTLNSDYPLEAVFKSPATGRVTFNFNFAEGLGRLASLRTTSTRIEKNGVDVSSSVVVDPFGEGINDRALTLDLIKDDVVVFRINTTSAIPVSIAYNLRAGFNNRFRYRPDTRRQSDRVKFVARNAYRESQEANVKIIVDR